MFLLPFCYCLDAGEFLEAEFLRAPLVDVVDALISELLDVLGEYFLVLFLILNLAGVADPAFPVAALLF